jgi:hypothetical protein
LKTYFDNYFIENKIKIDFADESYIKNIKIAIKFLLAEIGIELKYVNKNTSGLNDKMIIYYKNFKSSPIQFKGRLNPKLDKQIHKNQVKNTKNTFQYNNKKVYTTQNENIFTTYHTNQ